MSGHGPIDPSNKKIAPLIAVLALILAVSETLAKKRPDMCFAHGQYPHIPIAYWPCAWHRNGKRKARHFEKGGFMQSAVWKAVALVLAMLLLCGCTAQRDTSPRRNLESGSQADGRPCVAHLSVEGGYWSGHAVRSFEHYQDSAKGEAFAYLLSKITSLGYTIDSSDRETGSIRAVYPVTLGKGEATVLNAAINGRGQSGIRVDLTFTTGALATFSLDEVRQEFCSILEGVPKKEKTETIGTRIREESIVGKKPPAAEKPVVVEKPAATEKPAPSALQTPVPRPPKMLIVIKKANLREKATTQSRITGRLKKGDTLDILDRSGTWFRVKSPSGQTGWIFETLVRRLN